MVLLTMLHLCNGAANIKNNILVPRNRFPDLHEDLLSGPEAGYLDPWIH